MIHHILSCCFLLALAVASTFGQYQPQNIRITNDLGRQAETAIAINPLSENVMLAGFNWYTYGSDHVWISRNGYAFSTNGGNNWSVANKIRTDRIGIDPSVAFDRSNHAYYCCISADVPGQEINGPAYVFRSTDLGSSWSSTNVSGLNSIVDIPSMIVDNTVNNGRVYVTWVNIPGLPTSIRFAFSTDTAAHFTFSSTDPLGDASNPFPNPSGTVSGPVIAVGRNSQELYVCWYRGTEIPAGQVSLTYPNYIKVRKSTNLGLTFSPAVNAVQVTTPYAATKLTMAVNPVNGYIFIGYTDGSTVKLIRSTDYGGSFSTLTLTGLPTTGQNCLPWVTVSPTGVLQFTYIHTDGVVGTDPQDVYLAESFDNGSTFQTPHIKITSNSSTKIPGAKAEPDYEGGTSRVGVIYPSWTDYRDNSNTNANPYTAIVYSDPTSTAAYATWGNNQRKLAYRQGQLHLVFETNQGIWYSRKTLNDIAWNYYLHISTGNSNSRPCLWVTHDNSLHAVWQQQISTTVFDLYYSRSTDGGNSWTTPVVLPGASNITIASSQWNIYPVITEWNSSQIVVVFSCVDGLKYSTSTNNGNSWSTATNLRTSYVGPRSSIWYPSLASGSTYLSLTYDYRAWSPELYSMTYNGTSWSSESNVNAGTGTVYDRISSIAVDVCDRPIVAWCAQKIVGGVLDSDYRILYRQGYSDNTWSGWFVEFAKTSGISDVYPSIVAHYPVQGMPYGIGIFYHRTNLQVKSQGYDSQTGSWGELLWSNSGQWPIVSIQNPLYGPSLKTWTDQNGAPYQVKLSSSYSPQNGASDASYLQCRRGVIQHMQSQSYLTVEMSKVKVVTISDTLIIPFKAHDISQPLNITLQSMWDYLGTDTITLPETAHWLLIN